MKIAVDIDGTVVDFSNKFVRHMAKKGKYILNKDAFLHMDDYAKYEDEDMAGCFSLDFYPNAKHVLKNLARKNNELTFLTKRGSHSLNADVKYDIEMLTIKWQKEHFDYFAGIIFTKNKADYASWFDVMIEDDASNANSMAPFCQVILINRGWNRNVELNPSIIVAEDWLEVEFILDNLDKFKTTKENS